ncbi:MAG: YIP1 family protein [Candidatus Firestonebacteria bacterium]|nr:YIP1 family protein [Candidatus Firestonebacteria bacterium]
MEIYEIIRGIILDPNKGFSDVLAYKRPLLLSFIIVITSLFCQNIAVLLQMDFNIGSSGILILSYFARLFFFLISWIILTSLYNFIASMQNKFGNLNHLFILFGVSLLPMIFLPAAAIFSLVITKAGGILYTIFYLFILLWILYLEIKSLKMIYNIETGKAVFIYVMPFISVIIFVVISIIILFTSIVWLISSNF